HRFRQMMNFEYDGFFRIGMHHRNERNAIIQHGTMTLVRASALRANGDWSQWCICEDAELGLRLMKAGFETRYVDRVMGRGLTPDTFNAFKKQRRRWAEGAMQILRAHARALLLPGELSLGQRYHFVAGWLSWIGDALHLLFAFGAMAWTIAMVAYPKGFSLPILLFMVPLLGFFAVKTLLGPLLYLRRVRCSLADVGGAALAGMALSHGIARGIWSGLTHKTAVFEITVKGTGSAVQGTVPMAVAASGDVQPAVRDQAQAAAKASEAAKQPNPAPWGGAREEGFLLIGLATCIVAMGIWRQPNHVESAMWMTILAMQAVPYAAALLCVGLSRLPNRLSRADRRVRADRAARALRQRAFEVLGGAGGGELPGGAAVGNGLLGPAVASTTATALGASTRVSVTMTSTAMASTGMSSATASTAMELPASPPPSAAMSAEGLAQSALAPAGAAAGALAAVGAALSSGLSPTVGGLPSNPGCMPSNVGALSSGVSGLSSDVGSLAPLSGAGGMTSALRQKEQGLS
ncbi:MAG: glycosyltransferase family 2 protein, partial [Burkholderiaceae bacterium]